MKRIKITLTILILSLSAYSAQGDLDTTFGNGGKVTTAFGTSFDTANAVAIQTDGKIVVAGGSYPDSTVNDEDIALVRFNTDGTIDTSFGTNGKVLTDIETFERANAIEILADGSILVAGSISSGLGRFVLAKFTSSGILDGNFGTNGIVQTGVANTTFADLSGEAMTLQSDGKILVAGFLDTSAFGNMSFDFAVARYNSDGSLDTAFGSQNGLEYISNGSVSLGRAIALQTDGKIVIVGETGSSGKDFMVVRLNSDGTLDTTFDPTEMDGIVTSNIAADDFPTAVNILQNGKILVSGRSSGAGGFFSTILYDTDGSVEISRSDNLGNSERVSSNAVQIDGKILVVGSSSNATSGLDFNIIRYNSDLTLDDSLIAGFKISPKITDSLWGTNGVVRTDFSGNADFANAVAIDSAGRIVVAGSANNGTDPDFAVARYLNLAPTAASATISGKVLSPNGRGIPRTIVHLTDQIGNIKTARTNQFGYYRFDDIEVGQTVILNAYNKQYQFNSQVINLDDSITGLNIIAQ
jgi:uncharacterized delta-60 repeat protein